MSASPSPFSLSGTFVVTGGTRGIGRAISKQFARAGAHVVANYIRNERAAQELQSEANREGLVLTLCRADLSTPDGIARVETMVRDTSAALAGIVHCAATGTHRAVEALTSRHLEWTFALNARALFELVTRMIGSFDRGGSILAISSLGATHSIEHYTAVGVSKGALEALVRHFATELAPRGIRANILRPGAVATDAWKAIPDAAARLEEASRRSPLGRLVTAEEVAMCAQFLCSPAASGVNGQSLVVDGGSTLRA